MFSQFPGNAAWKSVRELEFRGWQACYANRDADGTTTVAADCVHDIAIRCPGLKKLSFTLVPDVLLQPDCFEAKTNFSRVLENERLERIRLFVDTSGDDLPAMGQDWEDRFEECTAALESKVVEMGRKLVVERRVWLPVRRVYDRSEDFRWVSYVASDHPLA